jgi:hypothetical protein
MGLIEQQAHRDISTFKDFTPRSVAAQPQVEVSLTPRWASPLHVAVPSALQALCEAQAFVAEEEAGRLKAEAQVCRH